MERRLAAECLDELPVNDAAAAGSRRDLERLNAWMGNARRVAYELRRLPVEQRPGHITDIGAGDGKFMLAVARRLPEEWHGTRVTLVDRQAAMPGDVGLEFARLGWRLEVVQADVLDLIRQRESDWGATIANLFLHHFSETQLQRLLGGLARRTQMVIAVDPRRSRFALLASFLVGVIGCNRVTRHDAPVSVRAGFSAKDLSARWPDHENWILQEGPSQCFSHLFVARRSK